MHTNRRPNPLRHSCTASTQLVFQPPGTPTQANAICVIRAVDTTQSQVWKNLLKANNCLWLALQWVPPHREIDGNEGADKLANKTAEDCDWEVSMNEKKIIIKSIYKSPQVNNSYQSLFRQEEMIRLRINTRNFHLRINALVPLCAYVEKQFLYSKNTRTAST